MPDNERLQTLIASLNDPHVSVGWNAARELAKLGAEAQTALPALAEMMRGHDATSALWARFAVARITQETAKHLPVFVEALREKRVYPGMAATALAGFGAEAKAALPALMEALSDANADNRWSAAWAIASIGSEAREAVPALIPALRDEDEKVRWYVAYALSEIGEAAHSAVPALIAALNDSDEDVRGYAARALGRIGRQAKAALPVLHSLLTEDNPTLREEVSQAIQQIEE